MSDSTHTPTPWEPDKYGQLRGANGVPVNTKHLGLSQSLGGGDNPEASANAAFIVKAVNCHDELVAALKASIGNMLNAKIALDVGDTKAKVSAQLATALKSAEDALSRAEQP